MTKKNNAIHKWSSVLGEEQIIHKSLDATYQAVRSTTATIIQPLTIDDLRAAIEIANESGSTLYPLSTGRNWGYGSALATLEDSAILSLARLDRILDYDPRLGVVTVEPGVTQAQLASFLRDQGGRHWMDCTGSSPECSVVGNTLERGFGHTPYADHAAQLVSMEVMLPTGELITTGFGRYTNAWGTSTYRAGVGPALDQLFIQSNLGIVTKMTLSLMPAPEYFEAYFFNLEDGRKLPEVIEILRPLRFDGTIQSAAHLGNSYRVLSSIRQYPWEEAVGQTPLPDEVLKQFATDWDFGAWNGSGGIYGSKRQVRQIKKRLARHLKGTVKRVRFINDKKLAFAEKHQHSYQKLTGINLPEILKLLKPVYGMMKGEPSDAVIKSTYWRKKMAIPEQMDPDRDRCGLIWCSPVAPFTGEHARRMTDIASETLLSHGFEPGMTLTLLNERNLENVISISYDRDIPGEDEKAMHCYFELEENLAKAGYYPYRLGIHAMQSALGRSEPAYNALLRKLKQAIDPNDILSPGRYII